MHINTNNLLLYRNFKYQCIFDNFVWVINNYENPNISESDICEKLSEAIYQLLAMAESHGFNGNLWHNYLTFELVYNENSFSTACEITGPVSGSIKSIAIADFKILRMLYQFDLRLIEKSLNIECLRIISDYVNSNRPTSILNEDILPKLNQLHVLLSKTSEEQEFYNIITDFYKQYGVGKFGIYKAFRIESSQLSAKIVPVSNTEKIQLEDLVGYELQKQELINNTEAFVHGRKANNVLLYGDSGTGKSSSIKAILNKYYPQGLRIIEIYKHQLMNLSSVISQIQDRNYKFILYMDDLSFEDYETEYKYLKAIIEGGLEKKPENVLIYATSNRRHLIREKWTDKNEQDNDLHTGETVQEKLSLAARFGLTILYVSPSRKEYQHIVKVLSEKHGITLPEEELYLEANRWEIRHGGLSGRTAQHFINYLVGKNI